MKFVGITRVKNEERWIDKCLRSMLRFCDAVVLLDDHSTDNTVKIASQFLKVTVVKSPFEDFNEARDKDFLLRYAVNYSPDWVIMIDGDEELEAQAGSKILKIVEDPKNKGYSVLSMPILYFWDNLNTIRIDGVYAKFARPSAFRLEGESVRRLEFNKTGGLNSANLHCSNFPQGLKGGILSTLVRVKHYGYLFEEDRQRKFNWYNSIDPGSVNEDGYRHIIGQPNRHAPGPVTLAKWSE